MWDPDLLQPCLKAPAGSGEERRRGGQLSGFDEATRERWI